MWCSRLNGKLMFYLGVMLVMVGLGLVIMGNKVLGASLMCIGMFPLVIGFVLVVFHLKLDMKYGKKGSAKKSNSGGEGKGQ